MDSPENDLPTSAPFRVAGFPTLKFKPAHSREFLDYDGDRSLESLIAYVEKHAKTSLEPLIKIPVEPEAQVTLKHAETGEPEQHHHEHDEHDEL